MTTEKKLPPPGAVTLKAAVGGGGTTLTEVLADLVLSAMEAAEIEMVAVLFVGAVMLADIFPVGVMVPALADQDTVESKFPVP
jgi:hypothetical protein